jgi:hypothetical protein
MGQLCVGKVCLPWGRGSNEELRAIGIFSSIGHAEKTSLGVLQLEVLIREPVAIDYEPLTLRPTP